MSKLDKCILWINVITVFGLFISCFLPYSSSGGSDKKYIEEVLILLYLLIPIVLIFIHRPTSGWLKIIYNVLSSKALISIISSIGAGFLITLILFLVSYKRTPELGGYIALTSIAILGMSLFVYGITKTLEVIISIYKKRARWTNYINTIAHKEFIPY